MEIIVETEEADAILYFIIDSKGKIQSSEKLNIDKDKVTIKITSEVTKKLQIGANNIKIFAISDSVLKPDFYESNFLVSENNSKIPIPIINSSNIENEKNYNTELISIMIIILIIGIIIFVKIKNHSKP